MVNCNNTSIYFVEILNLHKTCILFLFWTFFEIILMIQFSDKNWTKADDGRSFELFNVTQCKATL